MAEKTEICYLRGRTNRTKLKESNSVDVSTYDRDLEAKISIRLHERIDKFPRKFKSQLAEKQRELIYWLVNDVASFVREVLAVPKMPITKYHLDFSTWSDNETEPVKMLVSLKERKELDKRYDRVLDVINNVRETKFDELFVMGKNWESEDIDIRTGFKQLKNRLLSDLAAYADYIEAGRKISKEQRREDGQEQRSLLPARHLVAALAQRLNTIAIKISPKSTSSFFAVAKLVFEVAKETLDKDFNTRFSIPDVENLIRKHIAATNLVLTLVG